MRSLFFKRLNIHPLPLSNEHIIIKDCINNCRLAQKKVYEYYAALFFSICLRYAKNNAEAEQLLQDAFLKIYLNIQSYEFKGSFEGWMKRIVVRTCLDAYKTKNYITDKNTDYFDTLLDMDNYISTNAGIENMTQSEVYKLINSLPDMTRNVFNLFVFEGYNHKEISELFGVSEGTSQWHVNNARKILKAKIEYSSIKEINPKHEKSKVG